MSAPERIAAKNASLAIRHSMLKADVVQLRETLTAVTNALAKEIPAKYPQYALESEHNIQNLENDLEIVFMAREVLKSMNTEVE